jgi:23S rRNA pseudouridine2605 synthase
VSDADDTGTDRDDGTVERLQKLLAAAGHGSRRSCEDLIRQGRVTVDGRVAVLGDRADPEHQRVEVDGVRVRSQRRTVVYLLNKPRGFVTTVSDERGRPTVMELVPATPLVHPVGRLDMDTEGLLLLTNDGDLTQVVTHPRHGLDKVYVVTVDGVLNDVTLRRLRGGVTLEDGVAVPESVRVLGRRKASTMLEVRFRSGRNRIVRRTFDAIDHPVRRLVRTSIGPLRDPSLRPGRWRRLNPQEIASVEAAARTSGDGGRPRPRSGGGRGGGAR